MVPVVGEVDAEEGDDPAAQPWPRSRRPGRGATAARPARRPPSRLRGPGCRCPSRGWRAVSARWKVGRLRRRARRHSTDEGEEEQGGGEGDDRHARAPVGVSASEGGAEGGCELGGRLGGVASPRTWRRAIEKPWTASTARSTAGPKIGCAGRLGQERGGEVVEPGPVRRLDGGEGGGQVGVGAGGDVELDGGLQLGPGVGLEEEVDERPAPGRRRPAGRRRGRRSRR